MSFIIAKEYLDKMGYGDRVMEFNVSSATVELAALAVGTEPAKIAKSSEKSNTRICRFRKS